MTYAGRNRRELSGLAFLLRGDGGRGDTIVLPSFADKLHRSRSQLEENSFLESLEPAILLIWRGCFGSASHVFTIEKRCKTMYIITCVYKTYNNTIISYAPHTGKHRHSKLLAMNSTKRLR